MLGSNSKDGKISDDDFEVDDMRKESLLIGEDSPSTFVKVMTKVDFFAFLPVPKDRPVSTMQSIVGSFVFIVLFLIYISIQFYQFINDNPPKIQSFYTRLDGQNYTLPRIAVSFQQGQSLDAGGQYNDYFNFTFTKENRTKQYQNKTLIESVLNDKNNTEWLTKDITDFYRFLRSPAQPMKARGLLYSTKQANYTKLSISICNFTEPSFNCRNLSEIRDKSAKGRIFLFIQNTLDEVEMESLSRSGEDGSRFLISNFFLIPGIYKRVTITFTVVKTTIYPDYFNRFSTDTKTKLNLDYVSEQTSNVTQNAGNDSYPLDMLGITFQLAPQVQNIRMSYDTIFDQVAKWGAFFNVLFTVFAIIFLSYNRKKFYKKNPDWNNFKRHLNQHS